MKDHVACLLVILASPALTAAESHNRKDDNGAADTFQKIAQQAQTAVPHPGP